MRARCACTHQILRCLCFLGEKICWTENCSKLLRETELVEFTLDRIVSAWSLSALSHVYLQTAPACFTDWIKLKDSVKDEKRLSSFEVALNTGSQPYRRFRCSRQQRYDFACGFSNFQNVFGEMTFIHQVDPRYGVKFNVLITSMQVGGKIC